VNEIAQAFEHFDLAMDPVLDEVQDEAKQGAIAMGLATRLVAYTTQAKDAEAEAIALSLVKELRDLRRMMRKGQ